MATRSEKRITVAEYERMIEEGLLTEDDRVELLEGVIVEMSPIGVPHATAVNNLNRFFARHAPDDVIVSVQNPTRLSDFSQPQPDLLLYRPVAGRNARHHPLPAETLLLVEVSDSTLAYDRDEKVPSYAAAGVTEVWIVDIEGRRLLRYREPADGIYGVQESLVASQSLAPTALPALTISSAVRVRNNGNPCPSCALAPASILVLSAGARLKFRPGSPSLR